MIDQTRPPSNPVRLLILMIIGIIIIIGATYALNGGGKPAENVSDDTNNSENISDTLSVQPKIIENNSRGTVTKYSTYGTGDGDIKIALIIGIDEDSDRPESIIPTLESSSDSLQYSYDVYLVNATGKDNTAGNTSENNSHSSREDSQSSDSEKLSENYVVPDIRNNDYDFTAEIHSSSDGSYVFVPSDETYTSKKAVENISSGAGITRKTPEKFEFANAASIPLIKADIPSMVLMTGEYYSDNASPEIGGVLSAIDNFDFMSIFQSAADTDDTDSTGDDTGRTAKNNTNKSESGNSSRAVASGEIDDT